MEMILDKEMPQKKRKRRFLLWWFFGAGVLLLSVFFLMQSRQEPVRPIAETNNRESNRQSEELAANIPSEKNISVATEDKLTTEKTNGITQTEKEIDTRPTTKETKTNVRNERIQPSDNEPIINKGNQQSGGPALNRRSIAQTSNQPKENIVKENTTITDPVIYASSAVDENKAAGLQIGDEMHTAESINEEQAGKVVEISKTSNKNQEEIVEANEIRLPLAFQGIDRLTNFSLLDFERKITIVSLNPNYGFWYIDANALGLWNPNVNLLGVEGLLESGYSFNDKFNLGVTLGIGAFKYSESIQDETAINVAGRNMFSEAEAENFLRSSFSNASFLQLGVHAGLKLTDRLSINGGVGYDHIFTSMFDQSNESLIGFDGAAGSPMDLGEIEVVDAEEEDTFTEFDFSLDSAWFPYASAGLNYKLSNTLSLNAQYKQVFGELFESSSSPLSLNRLQFGIQYRILGSSRNKK